MSFHWKSSNAVTIDTLISTILTELKNTGGWTETDAGYNVVTDPNDEFDLAITLEATNKRYLQFELGEHGAWNTGTHSMDTPKHSWGHLIADTATGHPAGTEVGTLKMSYEDTHVKIATDYQANGAAFRNCCSYAGLTDVLLSSDECLIGGSSLFVGSNATPTNDVTNPFEMKIMRDISGGANKPVYAVAFLCIGGAAPSTTNYAPDYRLLGAKTDKRYFPSLYLVSDANQPTGGEDAGIRTLLYGIYIGGNQDAEAYGATIKAVDDKTYYYFQQADTLDKCHFGARLLIRQA